MNALRKHLIIALVLFCCLECQHKQKKDSKEIADEKNESKFKNDKTTEGDARFVVDVIAGSLAEIKMAELGEQKAKNPEAKEIATMLKTQHTDIMNKFRNYSALKEISLPNDVTTEDKREEDDVVDEKNFDIEWCFDAKKMSERFIRKFESAATAVNDPELKDLATETLPTLRMHYDKISACEDRLN